MRRLVTHAWFPSGDRAPCGRLVRPSTAAGRGDSINSNPAGIDCPGCIRLFAAGRLPPGAVDLPISTPTTSTRRARRP